MKSTWRECLAYPQHVPHFIATLLDDCHSLMPFEPGPDRYVALSRWLVALRDEGLLFPGEHHDVREALAQLI